MIPITFQGNTAYLLDDAPDWSSMELEAALPSHVESGLTKRETRSPLGDTLRLTLNYSTYLQGAVLTQFRNSCQALGAAKVLCPLWMAGFAAGSSPTVTAACYVLLGDGAAPEIKVPGDLPFSRPAYPLLVGRLDEIPEPALLDASDAVVSIRFAEGADEAVTLPSYSPPNGLRAPVGGSYRPLLAFRPNWVESFKSGGAVMEIERRDLGQGRAKAEAFFAQPSRRPTELGFTLSATEAWQFLRLFSDLRGASLWVPAGLSEARLTANVDVWDSLLHVDQPAARGNNTTVMLDDLANQTCCRITQTNGNMWMLETVVGQPYAASATRIESLLLGRFKNPSVTLRWLSPDCAEARVSFEEVPWEADTVSGETLGQTFGTRPLTAYLYVFSVPLPGATQTSRFTGFERDLTAGGNTYTHAQIEHGDITEAASLDRQSTSIRARHSSGHPLSLLIPFRLEWPLKVEIYEADVSGSAASNLRCLFVGEVDSATFNGPFIEATASSLGMLFDRLLPRRLIQPTCNWTVFDADCVGGNAAMDRSKWKWEGTVLAFNASTLVLTLGSLARVEGNQITLAAKFFAGGYLHFGAGTAAQYRVIITNTAESGGQMDVTLASPFSTNPTVGATVWMHPGCDGRYWTCGNTFNNAVRFGGFPFVPIGNPSFLRVGKIASGGGKK